MQTKQLFLCVAMIVAAVGLSACGNKEKKPGQSLVSVNGDEITVLQLNEELQRSNVPAAQQEAASKQLLEALIDRQLLLGEATKEKIDRDPKVVQAIERAKALIIAQAYMQKRVGAPVKPSPAEVEDYFNKHPELFVHRKQFDMRQLVIASKDLNDGVKAVIDGAKGLDEVAVWLDTNKVQYARAQLSRSSTDLPPELNAKLLGMAKGQLFIVREGERSMLVSIADIKDASVTLEVARPQIEQYLATKKNKDAADAEVARLRAQAKIEYLNKPAEKAVVKPADPASKTPSADANDRGVAGLK